MLCCILFSLDNVWQTCGEEEETCYHYWLIYLLEHLCLKSELYSLKSYSVTVYYFVLSF